MQRTHWPSSLLLVALTLVGCESGLDFERASDEYCGALPAETRSRLIAYDGDDGSFRRQLYLVRADGDSRSKLIDSQSSDREPAFSPDGKWLSFTSDREGTPQIFLLEMATKRVTRVSNQPGGADQSSFSHDGALLAFHSGASVYVIGRDGTGARRVATGLDAFNAYFWPHFSLNDKELVFDRNNEINAVSLQGGEIRSVIQNTTSIMKAPAVSPDGAAVAYHTNCLGSPTVAIWGAPFGMPSQVCKGRRLSADSDRPAERPAWGSTRLLAYESVDKRSNLARIAVVSRDHEGGPCLVTVPGEDSRNPAWAPH